MLALPFRAWSTDALLLLLLQVLYVEADIKAVADWLSLGCRVPEKGGGSLTDTGSPGSGCEEGSGRQGTDPGAVISAGKLLQSLSLGALHRPHASPAGHPSSVSEEQQAGTASHCGIIALHACGSLTDAALEIAVCLRCSVVVMVS